MAQDSSHIPALIADIGGTNARFALATADGRIQAERILSGADYPDLIQAATAYLRDSPHPRPRRAAVAVATPVTGDWIQFTNSSWSFSQEAARQALALEDLVIINDFTALALALPLLDSDERRAVGGGEAVDKAPIALLGAGTGLGVSGLVWSKNHWIPLEAEGGHATFSATDEREWAVYQVLQQRFGHVSPERLLSGPGLVNVYTALAEIQGWQAEKLTPADITKRAMAGSCPHCVEVLELFCGALGTAAGNVVMTLGALGGVYIGGGIVPKLGDFFDRSPFRSRFEAKGRFSDYLTKIPTWVITATNPAFRGVVAALAY